MKLSSRSKRYIVPEYSLTGDLLSFLRCGLQYRYQNKGNLPPSMPIQLWFGEFIHGVMEEAYLRWENAEAFKEKKGLEYGEFPWDWKEKIRPIEELIDKRLQSQGLYPPKNLFYPYNAFELGLGKKNVVKELVSSGRTKKTINLWGPHLFPLIDEAEIMIKGMRNMPNYKEGLSRSNYYEINGIIDVLSSLNINKHYDINRNNKKNKNNDNNTENNNNNNNNSDNSGNYNENKIIEYLKKNPCFNKRIKEIGSEEYEVIIDYKGMIRPPETSDTWKHHKWQILMYSWLRSNQEGSKPVAAGIIFYIDELLPSPEDMEIIKKDILSSEASKNNISPSDEENLIHWEKGDIPHLSDKFIMDRSIRIVAIDELAIKESVNEFDNVVNSIEKSLIKENNGVPIKESWKAKGDPKTCNLCDFKSFCTKEKNQHNLNDTIKKEIGNNGSNENKDNINRNEKMQVP
ncbi:MAG: PD-(D/E)XK nuclease family protein [Methanobacteriaceae archaeon]